MLYLHVAQSQSYITGDEDDPAVKWKKLSEHFERGTLMTKLQLRKQYFKWDMREGASVQEHIKEMRKMTEKLAVMQSAIIEDDQVMTLLGSLPSSYDPLAATHSELKWPVYHCPRLSGAFWMKRLVEWDMDEWARLEQWLCMGRQSPRSHKAVGDLPR